MPISVDYYNFDILPKYFTVREKKANILLGEEALINESSEFMILSHIPFKDSHINNEYCEEFKNIFFPSNLYLRVLIARMTLLLKIHLF